MMRIIGGAIGPISITINEIKKCYPDPITYTVLYVVGVAMAIASVFLAIRMKHLAR